MSADVTQVAEHTGLLLLAEPADPQITGAYLVEPTGRRPDGEADEDVRSSDLAVLEWGADDGAVLAQPLELVLGRLRHLYRPGSVAVVAAAAAGRPGRSVVAAAAEAREGLLWGVDGTARGVVALVRGLTRSDGGDTPDSIPAGDEPLARLLHGDVSLHPLVDRLAQLLDAALVVRDVDRRVVAQGRPGPSGGEDEDAGFDALDALDDEVGLAELRRTGGLVGSLAVHRAAPLDAVERRLLDASSGLLALAVLVHSADQTRSGPAQNLLTLMLGHDLQAREAAFRRARRQRLFTALRMTVVVVEPFAQPLSHAGLGRLADQLDHALRAADPRGTMIVHEGGLVLLIDARSDLDVLVRSFRRVTSIPLAVGVGRTVDDVRSLPGSHREAARAATIARRLGVANQMTAYAELGVRRLLYQLPEHERRAYVEEVLGPVAGPDDEAADLRHFLHALRATHGNLAETARLLFVHRNTVRQRVVRLQSVLGPFLDDPDLRLAVFVAVELHRLDEEPT